MSPPTRTPTPGPDRSNRSARDAHATAWPAPKLVGAAVDGNSSGRDATVLGSLLARAMGAELMLIAIHEEPVLPVALPGGASWTALEAQARAMLAETRDSLAPDARIMVQADVLVWRGLRRVVRHEHRDLLVVGSARRCRREACPARAKRRRIARAPRVSACDRTVELRAAHRGKARPDRRRI